MLFLDEIHRMARPAEEMLYMAMEDFRVNVVVGKGPGATAIPLELPPFTLVGATTRAGLLPAPLRDRFGFTAHLDFYSADELETVLTRSAGLLDVELSPEGGREVAGRSRGTPRVANRLLRRVRDWAQVGGTAWSTWPRPVRPSRSMRSTRRPRPARPLGPLRAVPQLRRRPGRPVDAGGGRGRGAGDGGERGGAVPRPRRADRADAPWTRRHREWLATPRAGAPAAECRGPAGARPGDLSESCVRGGSGW